MPAKDYRRASFRNMAPSARGQPRWVRISFWGLLYSSDISVNIDKVSALQLILEVSMVQNPLHAYSGPNPFIS